MKSSAVGLAGLHAANVGSLMSFGNAEKTQVVVYKTDDRKEGVRRVLKTLDFPSPKGKQVFIKPNFNTADAAPGSTHNDTLSQLVSEMHQSGAANLTLGERSFPVTKKVMEEKGIFQMASDLDFSIINFEELEEKDWIAFNPPGTHWSDGFSIPRSAVEAEYFVSTCCLKTHGSGGVFTLSLKLAVGLTPKTLMRGMHRSPDMRRMIAEINQGYNPKLIVLDGVEAFVDGGPSRGTRKQANVFVAGTDRVAVDAVGVAILKNLGSNDAIMGTKIFQQEQIQRAVEVGLGISSPDQIELVAPDKASKEYIKRLNAILLEG
ncbi:MAG: DUF362 domain-containing protein [Candidatus Aminicenantaceae bacterium]